MALLCGFNLNRVFLRGDFMTVKEFLNKIRQIDLLIDEKVEEINRLRDRLTNITASCEGERVQTSMQGDKFADTIAKIIDLETKINGDIDVLVDYKRVARELIEKLDDDILKTILYKRYFRGYTFEQIAVEINYSWRWTCKLHGRALLKLNKFFKEDIVIHIDTII